MDQTRQIVQMLVMREPTMSDLSCIGKVGSIHRSMPCTLVTPLAEGIEAFSRHNGAVTVLDDRVHAAEMVIQKVVLIFLGSTTGVDA